MNIKSALICVNITLLLCDNAVNILNYKILSGFFGFWMPGTVNKILSIFLNTVAWLASVM